MEMKVGLTFACMNLKKTGKDDSQEGKKGRPKAFCLQSESGAFIASDFVFTFLLHFVLQVL